ncbi:hypothetical protein WEH80_26250 [Actinomycetes bacterium KLBMP 9759]
MTDPVRSPATALLFDLASGRIGAREPLEADLARRDTVDPVLGAVVAQHRARGAPMGPLARAAHDGQGLLRRRRPPAVCGTATAAPSMPHDTDRPPARRTIGVDGRTEPHRRLLARAAPATALRLRAVALSIGNGADGLQLGAQPSGAPRGEGALLGVAAVVERVVGGSGAVTDDHPGSVAVPG